MVNRLLMDAMYCYKYKCTKYRLDFKLTGDAQNITNVVKHLGPHVGFVVISVAFVINEWIFFN